MLGYIPEFLNFTKTQTFKSYLASVLIPYASPFHSLDPARHKLIKSI